MLLKSRYRRFALGRLKNYCRNNRYIGRIHTPRVHVQSTCFLGSEITDEFGTFTCFLKRFK